jgi:hypothetical protein
MGNNDLSNTEKILIKVDQNNLIYVDPNSVLVNGEAQPRNIQQENLVMYVNLEADIVPRSILSSGNETSTLKSIAKGTFNFLSSQTQDKDYTSGWTDAYVEKPRKNESTINIEDDYQNSDSTGQSFGIDSMTISVKGANFIPQVNINFIDVRGKTLFDSPENSPYHAFFHIPWPIFYLTVKGYYGKAIRYRLHLVKFNTRFNEGNGNFEITTSFVGSTYAFMNDIPLKGILNSPYMFIREKEVETKFNEKTGRREKRVSRSSKGYSILKSVYDEMKQKKLIPQNFPVKTLREIGVIAQSLDKILEKEIFDSVINPKVLSSLKSYNTELDNFEKAVQGWGRSNLLTSLYKDEEIKKSNGEVETIRYYGLSSTNKSDTTKIFGNNNGTLEYLLTIYDKSLKTEVEVFNSFKKDGPKAVNIKTNLLSKTLNGVKPYVLEYQKQYFISIDKLVSDIREIKKTFIEQRNKVETEIEKKMNEVIKDESKGGIGFDPTVRNLFAVILANAEVYVRLMKGVHVDAFNVSNDRKKKIKNFNKETVGDSIYPWPEIKKDSPGNKQKIIAYPGEPELQSILQSNNRSLWPEVEFVEEFIGVSTNKNDPNTEKESGVNQINYIFESDAPKSNINEISGLFTVNDFIPYTSKTLVSFLYEIYERIKQVTLVDSFTKETLNELADIEFTSIDNTTVDEYELRDILRESVTGTTQFIEYLQSLSPFERYPYFKDSIPTTSYIRDTVDIPFNIEQYRPSTEEKKKSVDMSLYGMLKKNIETYTPEPYRKDIFPYNSDTYLTYLNKTSFTDDELKFNKTLFVDQTEGLVTSSPDSLFYIKENYPFLENIFKLKIDVNENSTNILNTPYFHKQLYSDFNKTGSYSKYSGSAYLLLNSLPFVDLEDYTLFGNSPTKKVRVSSLFREVGSTHFIPYHLMVKWGSIYHRYKKFLLEGEDILDGFLDTNYVSTNISGETFFDVPDLDLSENIYQLEGKFVSYAGGKDVGIHPYYDAIYHQIVNGYNHFSTISGSTSFENNVSLGAIKVRLRSQNNLQYWTQLVDNSKFLTTENWYTLLPCDGDNLHIDRKVNIPLIVGNPLTIDLNNDTFLRGQQIYNRIIWEDEYINSDFSGVTFNNTGEYLKSLNTSDRKLDNKFSISENYRKVIDLIATFSPKILEQFEDTFLQFSTENMKQEVEYKKFENAKYQNFQMLLKKIVTIEKKSGDDTLSVDELINQLKQRQVERLEEVTTEILSTNNLIKLTLGNPKELDSYVLEWFIGETGNTLSFGSYSSSQVASNQKYIDLYIGNTESISGTSIGNITNPYVYFFNLYNIELSENNILRLRPLSMIFAGWLKSKIRTTPSYTLVKSDFINYVKTSIFDRQTTSTLVGGSNNRLNYFLDRLINKFTSLKVEKSYKPINFVDGYNNRNLKVELYNNFKSFNDKWSAGNSIGQRLLMEEFLFLDKANKDIGDKAYLNLDRFVSILDPKNDKANLYSTLSMLIQGTGFDMRALPAYVNFYGNNITTKSKITPSSTVAQNLFGTFLEVDYQESSPKIVIQYTGPTSKHLSDMGKDYKFSDDSFNISNVNNNPLLITLPEVFNTEELSKSNKVVAFEVSFGDQNQGIFKGVQLDQSTIRNTTESFVVMENLARSESGSGTYNVDIGLFDIYRQASYACEVSCMGNVMIQPTMFFYLKNVPMFRGSYWITEVSHNIKGNNITTNFKGTRIPLASLPDPEDSFMSSYRPLFDKILSKAISVVKDQNEKSGTIESISTSQGNFETDRGTIKIEGEVLLPEVGVTEFGIPYNGYNNEKYIQKVRYNNETWYRAVVARMGSTDGKYTISDDITMSVITRVKNKTISVTGREQNKDLLFWSDIKQYTDSNSFYSIKFQLSDVITPDKIISGTTEFLNPNGKSQPITISPLTVSIITPSDVKGPINVGPNVSGFGIGMSVKLMKDLSLHEGDVVYFRIK